MNKLVDHLVASGATRAEAQMIVDLARHACDQAVEKIIGITSMGATPLVQKASYVAALRMLHVNVGDVLKEIG